MKGAAGPARDGRDGARLSRWIVERVPQQEAPNRRSSTDGHSGRARPKPPVDVLRSRTRFVLRDGAGAGETTPAAYRPDRRDLPELGTSTTLRLPLEFFRPPRLTGNACASFAPRSWATPPVLESHATNAREAGAGIGTEEIRQHGRGLTGAVRVRVLRRSLRDLLNHRSYPVRPLQGRPCRGVLSTHVGDAGHLAR